MSLTSQSSPRLATLLTGALFVLLGTASACDAPTVFEFPRNAIPWSPPVQYDFWWALTEACAGRQGNLRDVQWYLWPEPGAIPFDGKLYDGYWWPRDNRIMLASGATDDGQVVRHEMLHQLLQLDGHPPEYFDQRCEGIVKGTGASSSATADPALVAHAFSFGPEMLGISLSTLPSRPRASVNNGWFVLDVQATNPTSDPVWVPLEPFLDGYKGLGFTVDGEGRSGGFDMPKEYRIFFAPGQRRHFYFDLHEPTPTTFVVRGGISGRYPALLTVVVDP